MAFLFGTVSFLILLLRARFLLLLLSLRLHRFDLAVLVEQNMASVAALPLVPILRDFVYLRISATWASQPNLMFRIIGGDRETELVLVLPAVLSLDVPRSHHHHVTG